MKVPHHIEIGTRGMPDVVFGHGWARSHQDFVPVAELISPFAKSYLLDLPGFGESERPDSIWGAREYANYLAGYLRDDLGLKEFIWVGHSFSGRIGFCLGANRHVSLKHLVIVAGAGLQIKPSFPQNISRFYKRMCFKLAQKFTRSESKLFALEARYGSPDYIGSRTINMRDIFLRVMSENLMPEIRAVACPTSLIYGGQDTETPSEIGRKLHALIPSSSYVECDPFDHLSVLNRGRYQIALAIRDSLTKERQRG